MITLTLLTLAAASCFSDYPIRILHGPNITCGNDFYHISGTTRTVGMSIPRASTVPLPNSINAIKLSLKELANTVKMRKRPARRLAAAFADFIESHQTSQDALADYVGFGRALMSLYLTRAPAGVIVMNSTKLHEDYNDLVEVIRRNSQVHWEALVLHDHQKAATIVDLEVTPSINAVMLTRYAIEKLLYEIAVMKNHAEDKSRYAPTSLDLMDDEIDKALVKETPTKTLSADSCASIERHLFSKFYFQCTSPCIVQEILLDRLVVKRLS